MTDVCTTCRSGLTIATLRLDRAARAVGGLDASSAAAPARDQTSATGAVGSTPTVSVGSLDALIELMAAEADFKANAATLRSASDMLQSLYKAID